MNDDLAARVERLELKQRALDAVQSQIFTVMVKEFPKYFAPDTALGIATDGEMLADEMLPDIEPIDLRSDAEKVRGECFHLTDIVTMESMVG